MEDVGGSSPCSSLSFTFPLLLLGPWSLLARSCCAWGRGTRKRKMGGRAEEEDEKEEEEEGRTNERKKRPSF